MLDAVAGGFPVGSVGLVKQAVDRKSACQCCGLFEEEAAIDGHERIYNIFFKFVYNISVMSVLNYPLTNGQIEIMKLFRTNMSEEELLELKDLLARFYADKAIALADKIWDERGLTNQDMDEWLNSKS